MTKTKLITCKLFRDQPSNCTQRDYIFVILHKKAFHQNMVEVTCDTCVQLLLAYETPRECVFLASKPPCSPCLLLHRNTAHLRRPVFLTSTTVSLVITCTAHGRSMLEVQQAPIWGNLPSILGLTVRPRRAKLFPKSYNYFKISLCLPMQCRDSLPGKKNSHFLKRLK